MIRYALQSRLLVQPDFQYNEHLAEQQMQHSIRFPGSQPRTQIGKPALCHDYRQEVAECIAEL